MAQRDEERTTTSGLEAAPWLPIALVGVALMLFLLLGPSRLPSPLKDGAGRLITRVEAVDTGAQRLLEPTALGLLAVSDDGASRLVAGESVEALAGFPGNVTSLQPSPLGLWLGGPNGLAFTADGRSAANRPIAGGEGRAVTAMTVGAESLWVGLGERLMRFDGEGWFFHPELRVDGGGRIRSLLWEDVAGLWVGLDEGLVLLRQGALERPALPGAGPTGAVTALAIAPDGSLLALAGGRLLVRRGVTWSRAEGLPAPLVCLHASRGRAWVGGEGFLAEWQGNAFVPVPAFPALDLRCLAWDGRRLWMGTGEGLWYR